MCIEKHVIEETFSTLACLKLTSYLSDKNLLAKRLMCLGDKS